MTAVFLQRKSTQDTLTFGNHLVTVIGNRMVSNPRKRHDAIFRAISDPTRREILGILRRGPDVAVLVYRVTSRGTPRFDRAKTNKVLATSLYVRRDGKWTSVLYQETPSP